MKARTFESRFPYQMKKIVELIAETPNSTREIYGVSTSELRPGVYIVTFKDGVQTNCTIETPTARDWNTTIDKMKSDIGKSCSFNF
jgi:hypothetical protein